MKSHQPALAAALLAGCAALAACGGSQGTSGSSGGSSSGGSSSGGSSSGGASSGGTTSTAKVVYGCNWLFESTVQNANVYYPETNAVYWLAALPDSVPAGDTINISGVSPTARYFSFEIYDDSGKTVTGINDADIFGQKNPAPAIASGQGYEATVEYNVVLASSGSTMVINPLMVDTSTPARKYLMYRLYLPTDGADQFADLPQLTYVAKDGTRTPLSQTPDQPSCNQIYDDIQSQLAAGGSGLGSSTSTVPSGPANKPPQMVVYRAPGGQYRNLDVQYMYEQDNDTLGDLLLVRGKAPAYATGPGTPQVRYWSVCSDESDTPYRTVQCLADYQAQLDADGYYNIVIAPNAPPSGYAASYDYLPWGGSAFGRPIYRQVLAATDFSQSIADVSVLPASVSMGDYYPQTTYCSNSVFSANLAAGTAAVFSACQASEGTGSVPDTGS
jgi:hypothetical protein